MTDYREIQIQQIKQKIEETKLLLADPAMAELATAEITELEAQKQVLQESLLASQSKNVETDDLDQRNALIEVKGAAGGDEANLFAEELLRMYMRYAERHKLKVEVLDEKSLKFSGRPYEDGAFGALKYEAGVHRVQRIPKTEKKGRIHTSTITVSILPELEDIDLHVNPEDVEFEAFRAGGHGGQNVNKVSTAVRIKHIPSGIVVTCQTERSQSQNREIAMSMLRSKLWELEVEKKQEQVASLKATQVGRGMRAEKIKTYNFPQDRLTDHRVNKTWGNLPGILDGDIDEMIEAVKNNEQISQT
ncbi:MAG TPA: PCRF domain-containing protein [Patescibacteria group bacterium]|nr:PCRF domain-containing protein [Patescibacteria group bacterium]